MLRSLAWRLLSLLPDARVLWGLLALALAAAASALLSGGGGALLALVISSAIVGWLACALPDRDTRRSWLPLVLAIFLAHETATAGLHVVLAARNPWGALFLDDAGYVTHGATIARIWAGGEGVFPTDTSIVSAYLRFVGAVFLLFGVNIAVLKILNVAMATVAALFVHRTVIAFGGPSAARIALFALLLFPSLNLWTSLALKEGFALLCATGTVWAVTEFLRRGRAVLLVLAILFVLPLQDTRPYVFTLLVLACPLAFLILRLAAGRLSWQLVGASAVAALLLIVNIPAGLAVSLQTVLGLDDLRKNMAAGARSAIVEVSAPAPAAPGDCFVVRILGAATAPAGERRIVIVPLGATLVYAGRETTDLPAPAGSVRVEAGDVVCVETVPLTVARLAQATASPPSRGASSTTGPRVAAVATELPLPQLTLSQTGSAHVVQATQAESASEDAGSQLVRGFGYLPRGFLYVVAAPFPWDSLSPARLPLLAELAFWYATVVLGVAGLATLWRRRAWDAAYVILVAAAVAGVLSLVEGNLGTLVRHRAMLIPFAVAIAAAGFETLLARRRARA